VSLETAKTRTADCR